MKFVAPKAILIVLLCSPVLGFNLDSLLIQTVGGSEAYARLRQVTSYKMSGKINWNGLHGDYTILFLTPNRLKLIADFESFRMIQGYDGSVAWQQDIHGLVSELSGFEKKELLRNVYFMSFAYLPERHHKAPPEYLGTVTEGGRSFHKLAHYPHTNDTVIALIAEQTGNQEKLRYRVDNLRFQTLLEDYRTVESILLPFHSLDSSIDSPVRNELFLKEVLFDVEIDSTTFVKPIINYSNYRFPVNSDSISIPFIYQHGHIFLEVEVNGPKSGWFILDTGASATYYRRRFLQDVTYKTVGRIPAMGLGGFEDAELIQLDSINIGSLALYDQTAGVLELDMLAAQSFSSASFGGILGYDFFALFPIRIDFQRQFLTVFNPETYSNPDKGVIVPFNLTLMVPTITARVNGISKEFIVDLGNPYSLIINQQFGKELGESAVSNKSGVAHKKLGGIGPGVESRSIGIKSLEIGDVGIEVADVIIAESSTGLAASWQIGGNIGTGILEKYIVLFDYPKNRILLCDSENIRANNK